VWNAEAVKLDAIMPRLCTPRTTNPPSVRTKNSRLVPVAPVDPDAIVPTGATASIFSACWYSWKGLAAARQLCRAHVHVAQGIGAQVLQPVRLWCPSFQSI